MKYINDMTESGTLKLKEFLDKELRAVRYNLRAYIEGVIETVTQESDDLVYELESFRTKGGMPESIQFDESDFDWLELSDDN